MSDHTYNGTLAECAKHITIGHDDMDDWDAGELLDNLLKYVDWQAVGEDYLRKGDIEQLQLNQWLIK